MKHYHAHKYKRRHHRIKKILNRGIISMIVLIIVAIIILGYYNISIQNVLESPIVKDNLTYALKLTLTGIKLGWQHLVDYIQIKTSQL